MIRNAMLLVGAVLLASCASLGGGQHAVDRMYVIECGENHVKDLSRWTPGQNVGRAYVFGDYCYLIKHPNGAWFLWDTGNADKYSTMPNGFQASPTAPVTAFMRKPLVESLKEIGVQPSQIRHLAMSHSHGDHSGNANLFTDSVIYMQTAEFDAIWGPESGKYNLPVANFSELGIRQVVKLSGDYDVFGDGSVVIKSTPGHTPGHQSLMVRLPKRGPVLLTGDLVHLRYSWDNNVVPGFNFDVVETRRSIEAMKAYVARIRAQVWVNHDKEQQSLIAKSPMFIE